MINIGIIVSAVCSGEDAQAIIESTINGELLDKAIVRVVITDSQSAGCFKKLESYTTKIKVLERNPYPNKRETREEYDLRLLKMLKSFDIDLVCLAGYLRIISPLLVNAFRNKIMNIHPALLPSFPGLNAYQQAINHGVKISGCTVHFVDEKMDNGPIILQKSVEVVYGDDALSLEEKIQKLEKIAFPAAILLFCEKRLVIIGKCVKLLE